MKSFIVSLGITALICIFFMLVFDQKSRAALNSISNAAYIVVISLLFIGYLLSLYWGVTGIFKGQRVLNFLGIGFSLFGLCIYVMFYIINGGTGKEKAGQFDHDLGKIERSQYAALYEILQQTNTKAADVQLTSYWGMGNNPAPFVICVQKGNIIALQVKDKRLTDVKAVSKLAQLQWLILKNCDLESIAELKLPALERLEIDHNKLTSLAGIENEPKVIWLSIRNNPIKDSSALQNHPNKSSFILN